jgi:hypothetical protein
MGAFLQAVGYAANEKVGRQSRRRRPEHTPPFGTKLRRLLRDDLGESLRQSG